MSAPTVSSWRRYRLAQRIAALGHRSECFDRVGLRGAASVQPVAALASFVIWVIGATVRPSAWNGRSSPLHF